eukprot:TRINITY_DN13185_c0_g5_i1.p1 TRINITY_DN13185_c0_g5~~TRINITY_DN13185_c0_g5_i1.p1  ORF type:complete len:229 (+),score=45.75 TRINITY_DN13185_c0_g5_i1:69-689(+)
MSWTVQFLCLAISTAAASEESMFDSLMFDGPAGEITESMSLLQHGGGVLSKQKVILKESKTDNGKSKSLVKVQMASEKSKVDATQTDAGKERVSNKQTQKTKTVYQRYLAFLGEPEESPVGLAFKELGFAFATCLICLLFMAARRRITQKDEMMQLLMSAGLFQAAILAVSVTLFAFASLVPLPGYVVFFVMGTAWNLAVNSSSEI